MASLESLVLQNNRLSGAIPPELGNLANLKVLWLYENRLGSWPMPPELGNLINLEALQLGGSPYGNQLLGEIPPQLGNFSNLKSL